MWTSTSFSSHQQPIIFNICQNMMKVSSAMYSFNYRHLPNVLGIFPSTAKKSEFPDIHLIFLIKILIRVLDAVNGGVRRKHCTCVTRICVALTLCADHTLWESFQLHFHSPMPAVQAYLIIVYITYRDSINFMHWITVNFNTKSNFFINCNQIIF